MSWYWCIYIIYIYILYYIIHNIYIYIHIYIYYVLYNTIYIYIIYIYISYIYIYISYIYIYIIYIILYTCTYNGQVYQLWYIKYITIAFDPSLGMCIYIYIYLYTHERLNLHWLRPALRIDGALRCWKMSGQSFGKMVIAGVNIHMVFKYTFFNLRPRRLDQIGSWIMAFRPTSQTSVDIGGSRWHRMRRKRRHFNQGTKREPQGISTEIPQIGWSFEAYLRN